MCELPVRGLVKRRRFGIRGSRLKASIRNAAQVVGGVGTDRAALHGQTPTAEHLFADDTVLDPEERLLKANAVMHDFVWGNQMQMQLVLARLLDQAAGQATARENCVVRTVVRNSFRRPLPLRATASTNPRTASCALRSRW